MAAVELFDTYASLPAATNLSTLVNSLGEGRFGSELLGFLNQVCGAEHCAIFKLDAESPTEIASFSLDGTDTAHRQTKLYLTGEHWRRDPTMSMARRSLGNQSPCLIRMSVRALSDCDLRDLVYGRTHICERLLLCGGAEHSAICLSILRSENQGPFSKGAIACLVSFAATLLALLAKHAGLVRQRSDLLLALTSLRYIEASIASAPENLPRRELEVCSRILYGISTVGISFDLGIGEETVLTYRKRAYRRLGIGCQRELLLWYIKRWSKTELNVPHNKIRLLHELS